MAENKNLVEDALLQMKNLEEAVAQNAKGILAATMGQEIKELVKESLVSEDEDEIESEPSDVEDVDLEDEMTSTEEPEMGGMDMMGMEDSDEMDFDAEDQDDEEVINLKDASDDEILNIIHHMTGDDRIIVVPDSEKSMGDDEEYSMDFDDSDDMGSDEEMEESVLYELEYQDDDMKESMDMDEAKDEEGESMDMDEAKDEEYEYMDMDEAKDEEGESMDMDEEIVYEIEMDEVKDEEDESMDMDETYNFKKAETKEGKMFAKPKGKGFGKPNFSYKTSKGGFKDDMKQGTRGVGMGKAKFEYKEGKKSETKEAARTLGNGKKWGREGSDKVRTSPRHIQKESVEMENLRGQVDILREKNEEYRKALNIFRQKLNEVAVFNSNLAYATRLFTEHSTSKQEKINILRRFDGVESIKESKSLYKTLKDELSNTGGNVVTESIQNKIDREPQSGSAVNLIESKTYENPQFLRMKDLMSKLTK